MLYMGMETYDGIKIYKSSKTSSEYVLRKKYTIWWCELIYCSIDHYCCMTQVYLANK